MISRVEFNDLPSEAQRQLWCDWLRKHGIDPNDVAIPGWIELRPDDRRIAYEAYDVDDEGRLKKASDAAVRVTRIFQLEAAPLPFPEPTYGVAS